MRYLHNQASAFSLSMFVCSFIIRNNLEMDRISVKESAYPFIAKMLCSLSSKLQSSHFLTLNDKVSPVPSD